MTSGELLAFIGHCVPIHVGVSRVEEGTIVEGTYYTNGNETTLWTVRATLKVCGTHLTVLNRFTNCFFGPYGP